MTSVAPSYLATAAASGRSGNDGGDPLDVGHDGLALGVAEAVLITIRLRSS